MNLTTCDWITEARTVEINSPPDVHPLDKACTPISLKKTVSSGEIACVEAHMLLKAKFCQYENFFKLKSWAQMGF